MIVILNATGLQYINDLGPVAIGSVGSPIQEPVVSKFILINNTTTFVSEHISSVPVETIGASIVDPVVNTFILLNSNKTHKSNEISPVSVTFLGSRIIDSISSKLLVINSQKTARANNVQAVSVISAGVQIPLDTIPKLKLVNEWASYTSTEIAAVPVDFPGNTIPVVLVEGLVILNTAGLYWEPNYSTRPDDLLPTIITFSSPSTSQTLNVPIVLRAGDNVGVTGYAVSEETSAAGVTWYPSAPTSFTLSSAGTKTLNAWVKDAAGNISAKSSCTVTADVNSPVITSFVIPSTTAVPTVSVAIEASDDIGVVAYALSRENSTSGLTWVNTKPTSYTFQNIPIAVPTNGFLFCFVKDAVGRISSSLRATTTIFIPDVDPPVIGTLTLTPDLTLKVKVNLIATDNVAITGYYLSEYSQPILATDTRWLSKCPTSYTFLSDGAKTLYAWARDAAGNISNARTATVTIAPDTIDPIITAFIVRPKMDSLIVLIDILVNDLRGATSYYLSESAIEPTTASEWRSDRPTDYEFTSRGDKKLYLWVRDAAGNMSDVASQSCTLTTSLSGREEFKQHLDLPAISLDAIKAYIGVIPAATTQALTSDSVIKLPAGEALSGHRVVIQLNGLAMYGSSSNLDHLNKVIGITKDSAVLGAETNIQFRAYMDEPSWHWATDRAIFLGLGGTLTQSVPTSGYVQQIATVITPTRILISIQEPIVLGD